MDRAMAALWRGADLSTISGGVSEAGQGASLQGDEGEILEQDDAQWLSETLSRQLDKRVIEYVFGEGTKPLAYIKIKTSQKKNISQELSVDAFLRDSGAPVGVKNTLERYNRPVPQDDDALLKPTAPQNPMLSSVPVIPPGHQTSGDPVRPGEKTGGNSAPPVSAGSFANSATRDVPAVGRLLAAARIELAGAQDKVLQPLRARLTAIAEMTDIEAQRAALETLRADLPEMLKAMNANPETAKVFENTLSAALLSGLTEET
jgi:hypothetical protein